MILISYRENIGEFFDKVSILQLIHVNLNNFLVFELSILIDIFWEEQIINLIKRDVEFIEIFDTVATSRLIADKKLLGELDSLLITFDKREAFTSEQRVNWFSDKVKIKRICE